MCAAQKTYEWLSEVLLQIYAAIIRVYTNHLKYEHIFSHDLITILRLDNCSR